jgi:hypothetical protein
MYFLILGYFLVEFHQINKVNEMSESNAGNKSKEQLTSRGNASQQSPKVKDAVQNKPGTIYQSRKRKINRRFFILLALWIIALVLALYFLTRN